MPVSLLNNHIVSNVTYTDNLTVAFPRPRQAFAMNVFNNSIYYQLGFTPIGQRDISWEAAEHILTPSMNNFSDVTMEGGPSNSLFAGIRVRAATSTASPQARVTVI